MNTENNSLYTKLPKRDQAIIGHVIRNRLSTNEIIQTLFFSEQAHATSVTRVTARLCKTGWLASFPLVYPTNYFVPGKLATAAFGVSSTRSYPLGPQALPTEYAILEYIAARAGQVTRLFPEELLRLFPWYVLSWSVHPHCLRNESQGKVLELLRVDLGGPADHVSRKCLHDLRDRLLKQPFRDLLTEKRFGVVILTSSTTKAAAIESALTQHAWPDGVIFRIHSVPLLLSLR